MPSGTPPDVDKDGNAKAFTLEHMAVAMDSSMTATLFNVIKGVPEFLKEP